MASCAYCGKPLTGHQQHFCSQYCPSHYHYRRRRAARSNSPSQMRVIRDTCEIWGKALQGRQTRFCSAECKNEYHQAYPNQKRRGLHRKLDLVEMLGGRCMRCGYDKNLAALSFHHEDEDEKNHKLDMRSLSNRKIEAVMREYEKCILLCANCHMELHYPYLDMDKIDREIL